MSLNTFAIEQWLGSLIKLRSMHCLYFNKNYNLYYYVIVQMPFKDKNQGGWCLIKDQYLLELEKFVTSLLLR